MGIVRLANVSHADVQVWVTAHEDSRHNRQKEDPPRCCLVDLARTDGSPATWLRASHLPRVGATQDHRYLTHDQVEDLAQACGYPTPSHKHSASDTRTKQCIR